MLFPIDQYYSCGLKFDITMYLNVCIYVATQYTKMIIIQGECYNCVVTLVISVLHLEE